MKNILISLLFVPVISFADCENYVGSWNCYFKNSDKMQVNILDSNPAELTQVKMGLQMGPFFLDNSSRSYIDSQRVEMKYIGSCDGVNLNLEVEQTYLGGVKVKFTQQYSKLSSGEMKLILTDHKPGKPSIEKVAECFK